MKTYRILNVLLLGVSVISISSCNIQDRKDVALDLKKELSSHDYDNGSFKFTNPNDTSINGTWTFTSTEAGYNKSIDLEATLFSLGSSRYGFDKLGEVATYGSNLQIAYKKLYTRCEEFALDFKTNFSGNNAPCLLDNTKTKEAEKYFYCLTLPLNDDAKSKYYDLASQLAFYFVYDNPKFFFLANGFYPFAAYPASEDATTFTVAPNLLLNETSFNIGSNRKKYNDGMLALRKDFLSYINLDDSNYNRLKATHDYVCNRINYAYTSVGTAQTEGWAHTLAGACIKQNNGKYEGVCECYAKCFSYLSSFANINSILITGTGMSGGSGGNHAWNYTKYNNEWYGIDCTWDDQDSIIYDYFGTKGFINTHLPKFMSEDGKCHVSYPAPNLSNFELKQPIFS